MDRKGDVAHGLETILETALSIHLVLNRYRKQLLFGFTGFPMYRENKSLIRNGYHLGFQ